MRAFFSVTPLLHTEGVSSSDLTMLRLFDRIPTRPPPTCTWKGRGGMGSRSARTAGTTTAATSSPRPTARAARPAPGAASQRRVWTCGGGHCHRRHLVPWMSGPSATSSWLRAGQGTPTRTSRRGRRASARPVPARPNPRGASRSRVSRTCISDPPRCATSTVPVTVTSIVTPASYSCSTKDRNHSARSRRIRWGWFRTDSKASVIRRSRPS